MTTLAVALAKIAVLEARLDALEAARGGAPSSSSSSGGGRSGEALPDHMLSKDWADKKITKDPKGWKGRTQVGRWYSDAPAEWLESMAGLFEWKAQKGREEVPVRLNNKNKPWHESDAFEAKLLRAWARRAASKPAADPESKPTDQAADDDFKFGANAPADDDVGF